MSNKEENNFDFSVVMAVYNVGYYLKEAIDSLINQTLSFEENIQLILVDDGSLDNSLEIAQEYQEKYPKNIIVLSKENGGVSSARNLGLKHATGKYVNFMDSDDIISSNTFEEVKSFFSKYPSDDYDAATIPVEFFEAWSGDHFLNYKFTECQSDFVDLHENPDYYQCFVSTSFFKRESIGDLEFDTRLIHFEDGVFVTKILMKKMKYGLVRDGLYYYRKRATVSATNSSISKREFFIDRFEYAYMELIKESIEVFGYVPKFLQNMFVYDLRWMVVVDDFDEILKDVFDSEDEINEFYEYLEKIFSYIDMDVILKHKVVPAYVKTFLVYLKNNEFHIETKKGKVFLKSDDITLNRLHNRNIWIDIVDLRNGFLNISGSLGSSCDNRFIRIEAIKKSKGKKTIYESKLYDYWNTNRKNQELLSIPWRFFYNFDVKIPIAENEVSNVSFRVIYEENDSKVSMKGRLKFMNHADLSEINDYSVRDNHIILLRDNSFYIENYSFVKRLKNEYRTISHIIKGNYPGSLEAIFYRLTYLVLLPFMKNKDIWIFMDRNESSGDNATHLFRYATEQNDDVKKFFTINKDSVDYKLLKEEYHNKIVPFGSFKHKILYLFASKIISSHCDDYVLNPFFEETSATEQNKFNLYTGLYTAGLYFLQHGVPAFDLSSWLRRYDHNLSLLLAVSDLDYNSFIKDYNYDSDIIEILGFPRFDYLTNEHMKKSIVILFTWRRSIKNEESLIHSEYYHRINSLINNEKLIQKAKEKGYEIVLKMHPNAVKFIDSFERNEFIKFDTVSRYHDIICDSALMITDYSSVSYDFAYLKKPIIYYQYGDDYHFDLDSSYIDIKNSGFGDIVQDENDLIEKIIHYIDNDCIMEDKYKDNVDKFFKYIDKNNSKRVYDWIKEH
ncbi:CDP-glycerol glycerophosphotransferase family protein [Methanobrevibacter ruminantium]|uniref:bifunctional glycosyltransferase/CDP-glycerol:glycerophosphate glycerophosphotransferase n=1 Tax=Methanobrevibacter ruminantium TaxID=83816 RepID=UPI0026EBBBED|nr:CDP-glycerol glycerophosphotransferase family protein [Methanobrevibacter ruminantium]